MNALAIARVELLRFLRERSNLFFVFVLPLLLVLFIGAQFADGGATQIGVVGPDDDAAAEELIAMIGETEGLATVDVPDEDELIDVVSRGGLSGGVLVPEGYGAALDDGELVAVGFVGRPDATARSLRTVVEAVVADQAAVVSAARAAGAATEQPAGELVDLAQSVRRDLPGVEVTTEAVGGDGLAAEFAGLGRFDLGASSQLFLFVFLTSLAASAALIQTRQLGVARRMLATPTSVATILLGQAGGRFVVALLQALYIVAATWLLFRVDWGDPVATTVLVLLFCLVSAAAGMLLGALFRNDSQASGAGVGIGLVFAALGGSMAPLEIFPEGMRRVAMVTPHGWANTAMAEIVRRDGSVADVATELGVLALYAAVLLAVGTWLLRRALTR